MSALVLLVALSGQVSAGVDVTAVRLVSQASTAQSDLPVTFGQAFVEGDVAGSANLGARLSDGTSLPIQVDKKTMHADGTLRHAVVTLRVPSLSAGQDEVVTLSAEPTGGSDDSVTLERLLATSFEAEVSLDVGGTIYSASARDLLQAGSRIEWLKGELVSEWIVGGPVKAAGGRAHPHLAVYFHVRAYAGMDAVRVDVVVENNWALGKAPDNFDYTYSIRIGGSVADSGSVGHANHARWHKVFWWGRMPQVYVRHDHLYLQKSGALPRYRPVTPSEKTLNGLRDSIEPMGNGDLRTNFTITGYDPQIGPLPRWAALYAISGDRRAFRATLANGDAGGSYSMHYRDRATGYPLSLEDYPRAWANPGLKESLPSGGSNLYVHDIAHQPSIAYVPYLLTGDYFYLEELQFWANYNMLWTNPNYRQREKGLLSGQVRAQAWALRTLGEAAYATPDDHPLHGYFIDRVHYNLDQYDGQLIRNQNPFGITTFGNFDSFAYGIDHVQHVAHAPWQDDFFTYAIGRLVEFGFTEARPILEYKAKYPIDRLTHADYCYVVAAIYNRRFKDSEDGPIYSNWEEVFRKNHPDIIGRSCGSNAMTEELGLSSGGMTGRDWSVTSYVANMYPALAVAVDSGLEEGAAAWTVLEGRASKPDAQEWANEPEWALIPRSIDFSDVRVWLEAEPENGQPAGNFTLSWFSNNAKSCSASDAWSGAKDPSGRHTIGPIEADSTFALSCTGGAGSASSSVTVTVAAGGGSTASDADVNTESDGDRGGGGGIGLLSLVVLAHRRWRAHRLIPIRITRLSGASILSRVRT